ncbi:MAG: hypothetical protein ACOJUL_13235 [Candidatus Pollutiaquabacter aromativorans]|jgi:hypothetical protein
MTPTQEMVMTLFTKETIDKVKEQFKNGKEIVSNESFDMSFRLFKPTANYINLELLIQMPIETGEEQDFPGIGRGRMQTTVMFFKPVGFFTQKKGFLSTDIEVTVVKEFENDLDYLIKAGKVPSNIKTHKLTLEENAVLAAFSMEAANNAQKYEDASFIANGLYCDIFMTFEGFPQVFLDDRHGLNGPIAAYLLREQNSVNPIVQYKELFDKFHSMSLMTAFKRL